MPALVLLFISLFNKTNLGLEWAAIILMFTSQAWNMAFSVYQSIRTVPQEKQECATAYGFSRWQRVRYVEIPFATTSLVFNSIMSVAGGWFFLMINEAFQLGNQDFRIPGLGSYMSVAAAQGNTVAILWGLLAMALLIITLDQLIWRPLVVWSQKFRVEETASPFVGESWFLQLLRCSLVIRSIKKWIHAHPVDFKTRRGHLPVMCISRVMLLALFLLLAWALLALVHLLTVIPLSYWHHLGLMLLFTLTRVFICLMISTAVALPLGLWIGLSENAFAICQPIIQIAASFPVSLLFPVIIMILTYFHTPLGINATVLMLLGTGWYLLFNVIAGARAMPSDLKEAATSFSFTQRQRFLWLNLPAIFPYLVTGLVTAAGGAWNTSIIAEYMAFKGEVLVTPGIGSAISLAAQNGNIPDLAASVVVLAGFVALINYGGWLRLYKYAEKRFSLNY
jgi:NitT/TauT family transport system permease protein